MAPYKKQPQAGDILLCYLTGVKRWVGALEITGPSSDTTPIRKIDEFPYRFSSGRSSCLNPRQVCARALGGQVGLLPGA